MAHDEDGGTQRKGKLSAFALLKSWLFDKKTPEPLPCRDRVPEHARRLRTGRFAQKAFGGDAEAKKAQGAPSPPSRPRSTRCCRARAPCPCRRWRQRRIPSPRPRHPCAPKMHPPGPMGRRRPPAAEGAVKHLEQLRAQGLSVETLAEALIIIESREVKRRK
jgi:hypothetical protein